MSMTIEGFGNAMARYAEIQPYCAPKFKESFVTAFWFEELSGVYPDVLSRAFKALCSGDRFPSLNQVKEACGLPLSAVPSRDSIAREIVSKIEEATFKFNLGKKYKWEELAEFLGELGVEVVGGRNGWFRICDGLNDTSDLPTMRAQWRELAKAKMELKACGLLGKPLNFDSLSLAPASENKNVAALIDKAVSQTSNL